MGLTMDAHPEVAAVMPERRFVARFLLGEIGGSLGDLGTFIPIAVGMVQMVGLDAATLLVFAGLMGIMTGVGFRIPMAVQPMKAIGSLAIAGMLTAGQVGAAGLTVGVVMLFLGSLGLINRLDGVIPRPVLRGLQVTIAFQLMLSGLRMGLRVPGTVAIRPLLGTEGLIVVLGAVVLMFLLHRRLSWLALVLLVLGLVGALFKRPDLLQTVDLTLWKPRWVEFDNTTLAGIWRGGLMQIPLTLLNSVFAVSVLATTLFPEQRQRNTPARIAVSVGLMNLVACPFGGMPMCHGSGGLAAQYRFGARTGLAIMFLGCIMLMIGLLFGPMTMALMQAFPSAILCVFLFEAGLGLALASRFWESPGGCIAAGVMVCLYWATGILLLAFAAAWIVHWIVGNRDIGKLSEKISLYMNRNNR